MFNPQQNININISYNLAADKKLLPAKKINKHTKAQTHLDNNCDIEIKLNKKNIENNLRKSNQTKNCNEGKKSKLKKQSQLQRNTFTPDLYNERRIKTEGPSADNDFSSAFKKDSKSKGHIKSVQQPLHKISQSTKKSGLAKTSKSLKPAHLASCNVPNLKKNQLQFAQHTVSQVTSTGMKKRRAHSTFIINDKVVAKLLSVSILASELGGSQPITSDRKQSESSQSRSFKQYMSSMDMRIIHTMQNDVPVFADKREHPHQDTIRRIMSSKNISLQQLTRKVVLIQRFLRQKVKQKVIHKYKLLFQQITQKMVKQDKISQISGIAHSPQEYLESSYQNGLSIFENEGLSSAIQTANKRKSSIQSQELESSLNNLRWIQQNQTSKQGIDNNIGLNLRKYRELVNEEMEKNMCSQKNKQKEKYREQTQQWKNINKQITNIMNDRGSIDFQLITDQLIKQSKSNQYWIDNDLDSSGQRPPFDAEEHQSQQMELMIFPQNNRHNFSQKSEDTPDIPMIYLAQNSKNKHKYEDSLDEDEEQNLYDKNKYEESGSDKRRQEQLWSKQSQKSKPKSQIMKRQITHDKMNTVGKQKNQQIWITQEISQDNIVKNYLDCGLDDFGINVNSRIIQIPKPNKDDFEENQNQQNYSLDEAIGNKFQQANLAVMKKKTQEQPAIEPNIRRQKLNEMQAVQLIQIVVKFLITEFATDISTILKKATGPQPEKKAPAPKSHGIATNFNAIRDYLRKFIIFIKKQEKNLQKITQTINKDIGPTSLQILTYLRPEPEDSSMPFGLDNEEQSYEDEDGLFVIPADIFQAFEAELQREYFSQHHKQLTQRMKAYLSFWHRCIFQSYNECLDYQRPYGIEGKPYQWAIQTKMFRGIKRENILFHLQRAQNRLLDLTMLVGGIIFQKSESPFAGADLSQEQKHMMNEQRLSRILANELLESESSWINYNDELAELLVQLSRMIEQKIFFEYGTELKKMQRRRKMIAQQSAIEESVVFNLQQL